MSRVVNKQDFQKRRHPTKRLSPDELKVVEINAIIDEANKRIAISEGKALHWYEVAAELSIENETLKEALRQIEKAKQLGEVKGIARKVLGLDK